jgi:hypothetical protein
MPGWKGIIEDEDMWYIVRYLRHLPPKGSVGIPAVFKETLKKDQMKTKSAEKKSK